VKINGNRAIKFIETINIKIDFSKIRLLFFIFLTIRVWSSFSMELFIDENKLFHLILNLNFRLITIRIGNIVDIQERLNIALDGSKIENKFVIIFIYLLLFLFCFCLGCS